MLKYGLFPSYTPFYKSEAFNIKDEYFGMELYPFFAIQTTIAGDTPMSTEFEILLEMNGKVEDIKR